MKYIINTPNLHQLYEIFRLEQHNPQPNPYLEIKARVLNKLDKRIEALNILNQAKLVYNESWTAQHQALLEAIKKSLN